MVQKKKIMIKVKEDYSREFLEAAAFFKPKIAIPFASNMCYLHKDTFKFNKYSNTSDLLEKYSQSSLAYKNINLELVLPGEFIDLNTFKKTINKESRNQLFNDRSTVLKKYRQKYLKNLKKQKLYKKILIFLKK